MSSPAPMATAADEVPVFIDAGKETVFGIFTRPPGGVEPNGIGVVFLLGTARLPSTSRNRMYVRMARRLAGLGYHAFRFDYHGVGESTGFLKGYGADPQFGYEFEGAVRWMEAQGIEDIVIVGASFGARLALVAAGEIAGLRGFVCMAPWLSEVSAADAEREWMEFWQKQPKREILMKFLRGLREPNKRYRYRKFVVSKSRVLLVRLKNRLVGRRAGAGARPQDDWVSPVFLRHMRRIVDAGIPVLFLFGEGEVYLERFREAAEGRFGEILKAAGDLVEVVTVPGLVHSLLQLQAQDGCVEAVESWLSRLGERDGALTGASQEATEQEGQWRRPRN